MAQARRAAGKNQLTFSIELGIGYRTLQRYEADGDVPNGNVIGKAAELLGVPIQTLYVTESGHVLPPV